MGDFHAIFGGDLIKLLVKRLSVNYRRFPVLFSWRFGCNFDVTEAECNRCAGKSCLYSERMRFARTA